MRDGVCYRSITGAKLVEWSDTGEKEPVKCACQVGDTIREDEDGQFSVGEYIRKGISIGR